MKELLAYIKTQEFLRMLLIGLLGVFFSWITYELIYCFISKEYKHRATLSWGLSFLIGIARQHALHRKFTFKYKTNYWKSLYKAYVLDSGIFLLSSILNWFLIEIMLINHRFTWFICLIVNALLSFVLLKTYVFGKAKSNV